MHEHMFVPRGPRYSESEAREAIAASFSWSEALRRLGMCHSGGAHLVLRKYAEVWEISTDHFDPYAAVRGSGKRARRPLEEILVEHSTFARNHLKERLYEAGLKQRICELCGQGELWRGRRMGLILDHVNGVSDDNRLENLRIVCPNCAATFDTHCARSRKVTRASRSCVRCGTGFHPKYATQRYCSRECGTRYEREGVPRPGARRVERPPYPQLIREIQALGYQGTGRRHGVSDNAVRKWVRQYERQEERRRGGELGEAA
jgi:ribosomal protein S27AE